MRDIIIDLQDSDTWKIQLTIAVSSISPNDVDEQHVMQSKSDNIKFTLYNNANKVVDELFVSLLSKYQENLETSMRGMVLFFIQFN